MLERSAGIYFLTEYQVTNVASFLRSLVKLLGVKLKFILQFISFLFRLLECAAVSRKPRNEFQERNNI
jgi:hypothetical protein